MALTRDDFDVIVSSGGGIGLRGPGEKQLETDRRLLGERVKLLKDRLAKLERQRSVRRRARERRDVLSVSLVGYTNAGKSTLFNALTGLRHKVGNYPGVTVERKEGAFVGPSRRRYQVLDLPGA
jgi:50S ribosomal subunit-associated GTPase HflX